MRSVRAFLAIRRRRWNCAGVVALIALGFVALCSSPWAFLFPTRQSAMEKFELLLFDQNETLSVLHSRNDSNRYGSSHDDILSQTGASRRDPAAAANNDEPSLQWLQDFIALNNDPTSTTPYYLRYICRQSGSCGGVGDRISGVLQAFYMAMCTNRRLLIDWSSPTPLQDYLQPHLIDWTIQPPRSDDAISPTYVKVIDQPNSKFILDPSSLPDGNIELQINTWLGQDKLLATYPCLQNVTIDSPTSLFRAAFWTLFQWSPAVVQATQSFRASTSPRLPDHRPYMALHIRTGRGVTFHDPLTESNNETAWRRYLECAQRMKRVLMERQPQQEAQDMPIYIAADTVDAKVMLQKLDSSVVTAPSDIEIYHIDRTVADKLQDPSAAMLQVWVDLKLLVDSACIVMSTGTKHGLSSKFSRMAEWLPQQQPRCAVLWHDCQEDGVVEAAIDALAVMKPH